jgi:hypothetical protein
MSSFAPGILAFIVPLGALIWKSTTLEDESSTQMPWHKFARCNHLLEGSIIDLGRVPATCPRPAPEHVRQMSASRLALFNHARVVEGRSTDRHACLSLRECKNRLTASRNVSLSASRLHRRPNQHVRGRIGRSGVPSGHNCHTGRFGVREESLRRLKGNTVAGTNVG